MKCIGEIKGLSLNWDTKRPEVTLDIDANAEDVERLEGKQLSVEIKEYRKKRSLEANNYHYALCSQIARCLNLSVAYVHNKLLRECHYIETIGNQSVLVTLPDTDEVENHVMEAEDYHLARTSDRRVGKDGRVYLTYVMLRGSHTFDTAEMSHLIDRTIAMAKELDIETLTENQRLEMMASYEQYHAGRK